MMEIYCEKIIDGITGKETIRPFTKEEIAQIEANKKKMEEQNAIMAEKEKARKSALAKLAALGLTADEIAAL